MKVIVLEYLFEIIYRMRKIEMSLLCKQEIELANTIRDANKALSSIRNRLITEQVTTAREKLNIAVANLQSTSDEMQSFLDERADADKKLENILNNLPVIIKLANTLLS